MASRRLSLCLAVILVAAFCSSSAYGQYDSPFTPSVVLDWNQKFVQIIRFAQIPSQTSSLYQAVLNQALYDAIGNHFGAKDVIFKFKPSSEIKTSNAAASAAYAAHFVLASLFKVQQEAAFVWRYPPVGQVGTAINATFSSFNALLKAHLNSSGATAAQLACAKKIGRNLARRILSLRIADGSEDYVPLSSFKPPIDSANVTVPGRYIFVPKQTFAIYPQLAKTKPFVVKNIADITKKYNPPKFNSSKYLKDVAEVEMLGAVDSAARTSMQTDTVLFWFDPAGSFAVPGHWTNIAFTFLSGKPLLEQAKVLARITTAQADVSIATWSIKYTRLRWRPITAVRYGGNEAWTPLLPVPPHPEYPSGHSASAGAAIGVLQKYLGKDAVSFTSTAESYGLASVPNLVQGTSRTYTSLKAAGNEVGASRIYAGLHFRSAVEDGLALGIEVGKAVWSAYPGVSKNY